MVERKAGVEWKSEKRRRWRRMERGKARGRDRDREREVAKAAEHKYESRGLALAGLVPCCVYS